MRFPDKLKDKKVICIITAAFVVILLTILIIINVSKEKPSKYDGVYEFQSMVLLGQTYDSAAFQQMVGNTGTLSITIDDNKCSFSSDLLNLSSTKEADITFDGDKAIISAEGVNIPCIYDSESNSLTIDFGSMEQYAAYGEYKMTFIKH